MTTQAHTETTQESQTLDARNLSCPLPILRTKKALNTMENGGLLTIQATDPGSVNDLSSFCEQTGNELVSSEAGDGEFIFVIRKASN